LTREKKDLNLNNEVRPLIRKKLKTGPEDEVMRLRRETGSISGESEG